MKKIILSIALTLGLISCSDYLDVNDNPNYPSGAPNKLIIPSAQSFIAARMGSDMFNYSGFFAQYFDQAPEANQYNTLSEYSFKADLFDEDYTYMYAGALMDLETVRRQAEADGEWGDYYLATVLRAFTFQLIVDIIDMAPFSEAFQGNNNPMPKWETGSDIYAGLLKELDEAEEKLDEESFISEDILLDKDLDEWISFANALRLKLYMRSSSAQNNDTQIRALIEEGNFFSGDIAFTAYSNDTDKRNPFYTTRLELGTRNHVAGYALVEYMLATGDPRIEYNYDKATKTSEYAGALPGAKVFLSREGLKNDAFGFVTYRATAPVYLYTQAELQFFIAEAYTRILNDDVKAQKAYKNAISANFTTRGLSNASVIYGPGNPGDWSQTTTTEEKIALIGLQKWAAMSMINNVEGWIEMRRLGYPKKSTMTALQIYNDPDAFTPGEVIAPMKNSLDNNQLVQRLLFPQRAVNLNKNTPSQRSLTEPVWWNK